MLALMLNWLVLSVAGALYLCWRLPRDYRAAKNRVSIRMWMMRFDQGMRHHARILNSIVFPPHPRWLREHKEIRWKDVN